VTESVVAPTRTATPEVNRSLPDVQLAALRYTPTDELPPTGKPTMALQRQSAEKKKSLYPMREPYAVELTSPIIFIEGEDRPPNTIIIVGFPRNSP